MFPFPIATPQGCNIQIFNAVDTTGAKTTAVWNKPVGVSHVYMMLIGAGGNGNTTNTGGGSGSVTVWYGAAQHTPDRLTMLIGAGGSTVTTAVFFDVDLSFEILSAAAGSGVNAGGAQPANKFAASGFYKATAGQAGIIGSQSPSATTFLSGGATGSNNVVANYGYSNSNSGGNGRAGFFQMQPIIVGVGGSDVYPGGIGCGGGISGKGGSGMVLIASW